MLTGKQKKAVRLMFRMSDEEVAAEVGVRPERIAEWCKNPEFRDALVAESKAIRATAARIASDTALAAAKMLNKLLSDGKDGKLLLDTLKASWAFSAVLDNPAESLEEILKQVAESDGSD